MSLYDYDSQKIAEVALSSLPQSVQGALKAVANLDNYAIIVRVDEDDNLVAFAAIDADFVPRGASDDA